MIICFDYGSIVPWVHRIDNGIRAVAGPDTLVLRMGVAADESLREIASKLGTPAYSKPFSGHDLLQVIDDSITGPGLMSFNESIVSLS